LLLLLVRKKNKEKSSNKIFCQKFPIMPLLFKKVIKAGWPSLRSKWFWGGRRNTHPNILNPSTGCCRVKGSPLLKFQITHLSYFSILA
jgi:hypothetical protein